MVYRLIHKKVCWSKIDVFVLLQNSLVNKIGMTEKGGKLRKEGKST